MGKLVNGILLIMGIYIALVLFTGQTVPGSTLWQLFTSGWSGLTLFDFIDDTLLVAGGAAIIIGSFVNNNSDTIIFGGIASTFLSFIPGIFTFIEYINSKYPGATSGGIAWVGVIFIAPLIIAYIILILDFWRGKD